ncbi:hypothetical protein T492DRAFT_836929 [Pavlovales sp. CCMP2436]|nr:hypothetical protein T492DRAFT_836929 [Pavlovales sp. CCMP2436]
MPLLPLTPPPAEQMRPEAVGGSQGTFMWPSETQNFISLRIPHEVVAAGCLSVGLNDRYGRRVAMAVFKLWELTPGPQPHLLSALVLGKYFKSGGSMEVSMTLLVLDAEEGDEDLAIS